LAYHAQTSTLILPSSHPTAIQAYVPSSSSLLYELEVIPTNRTSRRDDIPIDFARVTSCITSASGDWLATLDYREGEDNEVGEISLKLWAWDASASTWDLNTRIDRPHGQHSVTSVSFQPEISSNLPTLVSTGRDGAIKTWRLRRSKKSQTTNNGNNLMPPSVTHILMNVVRLLDNGLFFVFPFRSSRSLGMVNGWFDLGYHHGRICCTL
jgi:NET1-associated nuclear protein 1 (U3 small nucleolar RNA-associated protein 17)